MSGLPYRGRRHANARPTRHRNQGRNEHAQDHGRGARRAVKYNTVVHKLTHDADGVVVTVRDASGQHEIEADHCVCTLPFPLLRKIEIAPAFSARKMEAIANYGLVDIARVSMQTKTRFWRNDPLGLGGGT